MQKQGCKKDAVGSAGSGSFKVILALLTKAVVVQVAIFIIEIGESDLQQLFSKLYLNWSGKQSLILVLILQISFHKQLK